jgi:hypothetical protein
MAATGDGGAWAWASFGAEVLFFPIAAVLLPLPFFTFREIPRWSAGELLAFGASLCLVFLYLTGIAITLAHPLVPIGDSTVDLLILIGWRLPHDLFPLIGMGVLAYWWFARRRRGAPAGPPAAA